MMFMNEIIITIFSFYKKGLLANEVYKKSLQKIPHFNIVSHARLKQLSASRLRSFNRCLCSPGFLALRQSV